MVQNVLNVEGSGINDSTGNPVRNNSCLWNGAYQSFSFGCCFSGIGFAFDNRFKAGTSLLPSISLRNISTTNLSCRFLDSSGQAVLVDTGLNPTGNIIVFVNYDAITKTMSLYYNGNIYTNTNAAFTNYNLTAGLLPMLVLGGTIISTSKLMHSNG